MKWYKVKDAWMAFSVWFSWFVCVAVCGAIAVAGLGLVGAFIVCEPLMSLGVVVGIVLVLAFATGMAERADRKLRR